MKDLEFEIEEYIELDKSDFEISKLIKSHIKQYLGSLDEIFTQNQGKDFLVKHTKKIDYLISIIYKYTLRVFFKEYVPMYNTLPITLIALGSYGREELCVYSDIDLMIVYKKCDGYNIEPIIKAILHLAWDSGMKLGHRTHEVSELFDASNGDITIKTAMMESRFLCGSKYLWTEAQRELLRIRKYEPKEFITKKLEAYRNRSQKFPLTMEPNIKDGVGGLRDANTLFWISHVLIGASRLNDLVPQYLNEEEFREFRSSLEFLFRVRSALHLSAGKKQDVLNLDLVPSVSAKLGYKPTKTKTAELQLTQKTLQSLWILKITAQIFIRRLTSPLLFEKKNIAKARAARDKNGFYLFGGVLYTSFHRKKTSLKNVFKLLLELDDVPMKYDISVICWLKKTSIPPHNSKEIYSLFRQFFERKYLNQILYAFYKSNLLQALIKPMAHTINLPQFDGYHTFPVDIHSLKTLYFLENIEDNFVKALYDDICENGKMMLRLALLLHDVGKGKNTDHSKLGARIFKTYAQKLSLSENQINMGELLIRHHTLMSNIANREDIYNERVILSFASKLRSLQALKLLYILTYCDVNAVSAKAFSRFNAKFLRELYELTSTSFDKNALLDETSRRLKKEEILQKNDDFAALSPSLKRKILSSSSNLLFFKYSPSQIVELAKEAEGVKDYAYEIENDNHLCINVTKNINFNVGYLLGKLVIFDLAQMDIFKLYGDTKFFKIEFNKKADEGEIGYIENLIQDSFFKENKTQLKKPVILKDEIVFDWNHSKSLAKITLNAKDQLGLMAYIISLFDEYGIDIASAKIQTIKHRARNLFLIEKDGKVCDNVKNIIELLY
ncbi:MAG: HD domain-containing protein [Campylobacteraceae bacterium]|jgi:[protein-PII] uridylyltransferase|nr:HD domain-containing protein [Campylobacteraceae bacterium]